MRKISSFLEHASEELNIKFRVKDGYSSRKIIATIDGLDVAYFKIDIEDINDDNKNDVAYIHEVDLDEDMRGKGLSKIIFGKMIAYVKRKFKYNKFELEVDKSNTPALKLYKSLGFQVDGEDDEEFKMSLQ